MASSPVPQQTPPSSPPTSPSQSPSQPLDTNINTMVNSAQHFPPDSFAHTFNKKPEDLTAHTTPWDGSIKLLKDIEKAISQDGMTLARDAAHHRLMAAPHDVNALRQRAGEIRDDLDMVSQSMIGELNHLSTNYNTLPPSMRRRYSQLLYDLTALQHKLKH